MKEIILLGGLVLLAWSDARKRIIPNEVLKWMLVFRFLLFIEIVLRPQENCELMLDSILGAIAGLVPMSICYIFSCKKIAAGDVKLIAVIGIYVGIVLIFEIIFYSCLYAITYVLGVRCIEKEWAQKRLPFAPFVLLGTMTAMFIFHLR